MRSQCCSTAGVHSSGLCNTRPCNHPPAWSSITLLHSCFLLRQVEDCQLRDYEGNYEEFLEKNEDEAEKMAVKEDRVKEIEKARVLACFHGLRTVSRRIQDAVPELPGVRGYVMAAASVQLEPVLCASYSCCHQRQSLQFRRLHCALHSWLPT